MVLETVPELDRGPVLDPVYVPVPVVDRPAGTPAALLLEDPVDDVAELASDDDTEPRPEELGLSWALELLDETCAMLLEDGVTPTGTTEFEEVCCRTTPELLDERGAILLEEDATPTETTELEEVCCEITLELLDETDAKLLEEDTTALETTELEEVCCEITMELD